MIVNLPSPWLAKQQDHIQSHLPATTVFQVMFCICHRTNKTFVKLTTDLDTIQGAQVRQRKLAVFIKAIEPTAFSGILRSECLFEECYLIFRLALRCILSSQQQEDAVFSMLVGLRLKKNHSKEAEITAMRDCRTHIENETANANCSDILFSCFLLLLPIRGICVPAVETLP